MRTHLIQVHDSYPVVCKFRCWNRVGFGFLQDKTELLNHDISCARSPAVCIFTGSGQNREQKRKCVLITKWSVCHIWIITNQSDSTLETVVDQIDGCLQIAPDSLCSHWHVCVWICEWQSWIYECSHLPFISRWTDTAPGKIQTQMQWNTVSKYVC